MMVFASMLVLSHFSSTALLNKVPSTTASGPETFTFKSVGKQFRRVMVFQIYQTGAMFTTSTIFMVST